ncbi:MAG: type II secretion system protein [Gemmatimonadota bacterium]
MYGADAPARSRGFTLLELMVVIVLAGILLAVVTVNTTPDPRQQLLREARRIGQLVGVAADEARISSERVYWEADLRGYRFYAMQGDERHLLTDDVLRERNWERPLEKLAIYEGDSARPSQIILAAGAPPVRLAIAREWVQPAWRLELVSDAGRVAVDFDAAGRSRVVTQ